MTPRWDGEEGDAVVISIDQHASMARRTAVDVANWSHHFLEHNRMVFAAMRKWNETNSERRVDLVAFVGDGALLTTNDPRDAVEFTLGVVETMSAAGITTRAGIALGTISRKVLVDGEEETQFRQVVGRPVDLAVRLSWIAMPSQVLITSRAASSLEESGRFFKHPPHAVFVSFDKWVPQEAIVLPSLLVDSDGVRLDLDALFGGSAESVFAITSALSPNDDRRPMNRRRLLAMLIPIIMSLRLREREINEIRDDIETDKKFDTEVYSYRKRRADRLVEGLEAVRDLLSVFPVEVAGFPQAQNIMKDWNGIGTGCTNAIEAIEKLTDVDTTLTSSAVVESASTGILIPKISKLASKLEEIRSALTHGDDHG